MISTAYCKHVGINYSSASQRYLSQLTGLYGKRATYGVREEDVKYVRSGKIRQVWFIKNYDYFHTMDTYSSDRLRQQFSTGGPRAPSKCVVNYFCPYFYYSFEENKAILFAICKIKLFFKVYLKDLSVMPNLSSCLVYRILKKVENHYTGLSRLLPITQFLKKALLLVEHRFS